MPFSLFECRDGTFVVVPRGLAPPLSAYQAHGESLHLSDSCQHLYDTSVWDHVSREVDRQLYAVVHPDVAFYLFEVAAQAARGADNRASRDDTVDAPAPRASGAAGERRVEQGHSPKPEPSQAGTENQGAADGNIVRETV